MSTWHCIKHDHTTNYGVRCHYCATEAKREEAREFAARVQKSDHVCKHGHFGCSDREGGRCLDEVFSLLGLNNDGDPVEQ